MNCRRLAWPWLTLGLLLAAPAAAQHLTLDARFAPAKAAPGDTVTLTVDLQIEPGWHVYGKKDEGAVPTVLEFEKGALGPLVAAGALQFDDGVPHLTLGVKSYWVVGKGTLRQAFTVPKDGKPGPLQVAGKVTYMACTPEACDPPAADAFTAALEVTGASGVAAPQGGSTVADKHLTVTVRAEPATAHPGDQVKLVFACEVAAGLHAYGSKETTGLPIGATFTALQGLVADTLLVPAGEAHKGPVETEYWLPGKFELTQTLRVPADQAPGTVTLAGTVDYMVCNASSCLPPAKLAFTLPLAIQGGGAAAPKLPLPGQPGAEAKIKLAAAVEPSPAHPGEQVRLRLEVTVDDGWHVYGSRHDHPVQLVLAPTSGWSGVGAAVVPPGERRELGPIVTYELKGTFTIEQVIAVAAGAAPGSIEIAGKLVYEPCNENSCLDQTSMPFRVAVPIEGGSARPLAKSSTSGTPPAGGDELPLLQLILECIAGGLLALAMPCTYPMIPITFSFFTKQAEQRHGKVLGLALTYGAGIVLMFMLIGVAFGNVIIPFAGHWATNAVLAVAFFAFALSLFGLFTLQLPSSLQNLAGSASQRAGRSGGLAGVFFMGATLVVSSFTCTGPVVALLLARAAKGSDLTGVAIGMGVFGLTMALPFVVLSLLPGRVKQLPRSGEWMSALKVTLGYIELVAAVKFVSNVDVFFGWNILPSEVFFGVSALLLLLAALNLFGLPRRQVTVGFGRAVAGLSLLLLGSWLGLGAAGRQLDAISMGIAPPYALAKVHEHEVVYDDPDRAYALAKQQGKLVLHDFTGFFCTNCRAMELGVFRRPEISALLQKGFVESRQHVDVQGKLTAQQFATNKAQQTQLVGSVSMPYYAIVDPNTGVKLRTMALAGGPTEWESLFRKFLTDGL